LGAARFIFENAQLIHPYAVRIIPVRSADRTLAQTTLIDAQWILPGGTARLSANERDQTMTAQDNWKWCNKCQVLAFAGFPSLGACAAGGSHDHSGSGDYVLIQDVPVGGNQQDNWKWCNKCQVLAFAGSPSLGACADGGTHDHSGSGDYVLSFG
jgi:hypothetical protein